MAHSPQTFRLGPPLPPSTTPNVEQNHHTCQPPKRKYDFTTERALDGTDYRLIEELAYLSRLRRRKSPSRATYATPGRRYLARKLRVCTATISRHNTKLSRLGILAIIHRRKERGRWQTNLYRLIHWQAWRHRRVGALAERLADRLRHRRRPTTPPSGAQPFTRGSPCDIPVTHSPPQKEDISSLRPMRGEIEEILARWRSRA